MKLNEKIIYLRKMKGLTQEDLASIMNISRQAVSKWETGDCEPDNKKIIELSIFFEKSIDYLLKDEINEEQNSKIKTDFIDTNTINNNYHIKKEQNFFWVLIVIGFISLGVLSFIPYLYQHDSCHLGHSGLIGYLEDWCLPSIVWKLFLALAIGSIFIGFKLTFIKKEKEN